MANRHPKAAASLRPFLFVGLFLLFFISIVFSRHHALLRWLWTTACGCCAAYCLLKAKALVPSFLIWIKRREPMKPTLPPGCGICGNENCQRHRRGAVTSDLQPWNDVLVPLPVEEALSEFFELVLRDFVYEWYRQINDHEELVDEFRSNLQFIIASFVKRAKKIDIPKVVTEKLIQAGMAHLHVIFAAKDKNPSLRGAAFVGAVLREYGDDVHEAVRGEHASIRYLRRVAAVIVPRVLPPASLKSRSLVAFLEELTACQLLSRLCRIISSPDIVNKIVIELILPAKPVKPLEKPGKLVPILSTFARSSKLNSALRHPLPTILSSTDGLFHFMQFMKGEGTVNILQFCLTVEDLNRRCMEPDVSETESQNILREAKTLYDTYFSPTAWDKIRMDDSVVNDLKLAVDALDANDSVQGLRKLQQSTPLLKAYERVYGMLVNIYCPLFHQSDEYYEMVCGSRLPARARPSSKGRVKNRNVFKRLGIKIKDRFQDHHRNKEGKMPDPDIPDSSNSRKSPLPPPPVAVSLAQSDDDSSGGDDIAEDEGSTPEYDMSQWDVRIRSAEVESKGVVTQRLVCKLVVKTPTPIPTIATMQGAGSSWNVKRDWKQFRNLDIRLKNFHDELNVRLPSRGFLLRMSDETAEKKRSELEKYLKCLVSHPLLSGSQLLYSFLTPDTEKKTAFTLDAVANKAGTMLKSVKLKLKKEKGQHLEAFLQTFLASVETARPPHEDAAVAEMRKDFDRCQSESQAFDVEERDVGLEGERYWEDKRFRDLSSDAFHLSGVGEVLQYLIRTVYQVPRWLHHVVCCVRVLGQNSLEAYLDSYLCRKMEIVFREDYLVDIIHLLRDLLFYDDDPPRTTKQQKERADQALDDLLGFPPGIFASLVGRQKYEHRTKLVFEALQYPELNKQLFFVLLDVVMAELFPELQDHLVR
ncbi:sorting nexin-14-like isoform X2 [Oscarella lobularis]|uniref:sorting nexin-14-like isoform X2 n=1 Tax=Oscarella lobularis TaxID=121494 RepID=UPI0033142B5B